jgi:lipopolysaccharide transport system permease protein
MALPAPDARPEGASHGFDLRGEQADLRTLVADVWRSRELLRVLARKDFYVQYRRASFGILWAFLLPLVQALVLAVVIPKIARFDTPGSYVTFVFAGTTSWAFFMGALTGGVGAIVDAHDLSTKIYFPRVVLPLTRVLTSLYGLLPGVAVLAVVTVVDVGLRPRLLVLVPAVVLLVVLSAGFAAVLSGLQVYFRDVRYLLTASMIAWFYVTPVFYSLTVVERATQFRAWIEANPMTGVVELFRAATVGADDGWEVALVWTLGWTAVLLVAGLLIHRRYDRVFVDLL